MKEPSIDNYRTDRLGKAVRNDEYATIPRGQVPYGTTKCTYKLGLDTDARLNRSVLGI